jgi:hypothetical protein
MHAPLPPDTTPKGRHYDPALKAAVKEIKAILKDLDLGAVVLLNSPHYAEYLTHFPQWSCLQMQGDGEVRMYAKRDDFPSLEDQKACIECSTGMIMVTIDHLGELLREFAILRDAMARHFKIFYVSRHTPQDEAGGLQS